GQEARGGAGSPPGAASLLRVRRGAAADRDRDRLSVDPRHLTPDVLVLAGPGGRRRGVPGGRLRPHLPTARSAPPLTGAASRLGRASRLPPRSACYGRSGGADRGWPCRPSIRERLAEARGESGLIPRASRNLPIASSPLPRGATAAPPLLSVSAP